MKIKNALFMDSVFTVLNELFLWNQQKQISTLLTQIVADVILS